MRQLYTELTSVGSVNGHNGATNQTTRISNAGNPVTTERLSRMPKFRDVGAASIPYDEKTFSFLKNLGFSIEAA
jgi:hypothetical protein